MEIKKPNRARGDAFIAAFTDEYYERFMREWETLMNHYLETGEALRAA